MADRTIKFVPTGKRTHLGRPYDLMVDGKKIGYAYAGLHRGTSGLIKIRGTMYSARALDRDFSGSRATITREILRAMAQ